jgi:hypothetical protein
MGLVSVMSVTIACIFCLLGAMFCSLGWFYWLVQAAYILSKAINEVFSCFNFFDVVT